MGKAGVAVAFVVGGIAGAFVGVEIERGRAGTGPTTASVPASAPATAPTPERGANALDGAPLGAGQAPSTAPATVTPPGTVATAAAAPDAVPVTRPTGPPRPPVRPATATAPATATTGPATPPTPPPVPGLRTYLARVVTKDGKPVSGAWVQALRDFRPAVDAATDREGRAVLGVPGTDPISLRARARHSSTASTEESETEPGREVTLVLDVPDEGPLLGRVLNRGGDSLADAAVEVRWQPAEGEAGEPLATARSDAKGGFVIPGLSAPGPGAFLVTASHPRFFEQTRRLAVADPVRLPDPFSLEVTLIDAGVLAGKLVDAAGQPIPEGAFMVLVRTERGPGEWQREPVTAGAFRLLTRKAGTVVLTPLVGEACGLPHVIPDIEPGVVREDLTVVFRPAPPLARGRLVMPAGVGLLEVKLALTVAAGPLAAGGDDAAHTLDPATGAFEMRREFLGCEGDAAYATVTIRVQGCKPKTVDFNVRDGQTAELGDVTLEPE